MVHYLRAGATMALARYAKPQTTLNHYAKVSFRDPRGAVEFLPYPTPHAPAPSPPPRPGPTGNR